MTGPLVCVALGIEARAVRGGLPDGRGEVLRLGMGPRRAARAAAGLPPGVPLAVTGFAGALDDELRPGEVLVASEVRYDGQVWPCPSAPLIAGDLARAGLAVQTGPVVTTRHIVTGRVREEPDAGPGDGRARAADMESGPVAAARAGLPFAVVRVIVDTPSRPLLRPATIGRGLAARRVLTRLAPVLARWSAATGARHVLLGAPADEVNGGARSTPDLTLVVRPDASPPHPLRSEAPEPGGLRAVGAPEDVPLGWLAGARTIRLAGGPPALVRAVLTALEGLGPLTVERRRAETTVLPEEAWP
ncbi:hypothetical protein GCM10023194_62280 [Planotetraspora phitsanulokensis]|uniref:Nucleoside phosphorylase domain-containing protein n=1 Tax=Planotetraspora phitsanulokensis TaxID=575192 RepID=A0A8J3XES5_9ACTN|nr:hypothetical protein [Planotetraspora phitsanulokensis]GII37551.1 hypothetical protein Pph01_25540 [Planotetraspora phitsanulokensis]